MDIRYGKVMSPRFSPDGQWIAFTCNRGGGASKTPQLYLLSLFGGEAKQVTDLPNEISQLLWSPDSSKILFTTSFQKGDKAKLIKMMIHQPKLKIKNLHLSSLR